MTAAGGYMPSTDDLPALLGGPPLRPQGPPDWPMPDDDVRAALQAAYEDGSWGRYRGQHGERLEHALRDYLGVEYILTCASGTFAVELALRALKIGAGDEVLLAAYDYPGNFLCVHAVGAQPVLVDLDPDNWNLAPGLLGAAIGPNARALIVSHLHGGIVPMRVVLQFASERGIAVIEDAAQAPGAIVQARKAGTWGDVGTWSFGGSKLLSAGRGGAMFTQRSDLYQRARTWAQRGNLICPLSELQAAVLVPQLARLDERNARRAASVRHLSELLREIPAVRLLQNNVTDSKPSYYKVGLQYDAEGFGLPRARLVEAMRAEGIAMDEGFHAAHVGRSPRRFRKGGDLTEADRAHAGMLVLHHPVLLETPGDLEQVAAALQKIHRHAEELQKSCV
jgi:perosamine synthetase